MILEGVIQENGKVLGDNGKWYSINLIKKGSEESPRILIDIPDRNGEWNIVNHPIKEYIGKRVLFMYNAFLPSGFGYKIIKEKGGKNGRDNCNNNK